MAEELAATAVAQAISMDGTGQPVTFRPLVRAFSIADRAEAPIQLLSRWAGILAFVGTLVAIGLFLL